MSPDVAGSLEHDASEGSTQGRAQCRDQSANGSYLKQSLSWGPGKKRVKTAKYSAWCDAAVAGGAAPAPPVIKGPVAVTIEVSEAESYNTPGTSATARKRPWISC